MRKGIFVALLAIALLAAGRMQAQEAESAMQEGARAATWSFDPIRGAMIATPPAPFFAAGKPDPEVIAQAATSTTAYTGTVNITVTVKLVSAFAKGTTISCSAGVGLQYNAFQVQGVGTLSNGGILQSSESNAATISATTATCSMKIPYSWTVPGSSASTLVTVSGITGSVSIFASSPATGIGVNRSTQVQLIGPAAPPADGATITLKASTVL